MLTTIIAGHPPLPEPHPHPHPKPNPMTTSCMQKPKHVYDVFVSEEIKDIYRQESALLIFAHGITISHSAFKEEYLYHEFVPIFISQLRDYDNISYTNLVKIMKGELKDWKEVGLEQGIINIYLHGGKLQQKSFNKFLIQLGIKPKALKKANITYGKNYQELAKFSANDEDALVIGLKDLNSKKLRIINIDNKSIAHDDYPFQIPIYLYTKRFSSIKSSEQIMKIRHDVISQIP